MQLFKDTLTNFNTGQYEFFGELALLPLFGDTNVNLENLKTLEDLSKQSLIQANELSESGTVNSVQISNLSSFYAVIFDNDIVEGAKQNRVSQTTVILPPHSKTNVPVYCVERGRWSYSNKRNFSHSESSLSPKIRETKMMMMKAGQTENIQNEVWRDVDSLSAKFSAFSPTADFTNIIKDQRFSEESKIIDFIQNTDAIGYAVSAGKKFFAEMFFDKDICRRQSTKSVKSWLADTEFEVCEKIHSPTNVKRKIMSSLWQEKTAVASETPFETSGQNDGQATLFRNGFVHGLLYF